MELTPEQLRAARACGCAFFPATDAQVQRFAMQRRIFTLEGRPFVATRDGGCLFETWGTLAALIENHRASEPSPPAEASTIPTPPQATPSDAEPPAAPGQADLAQLELAPTAPKPRKARAPRRKAQAADPPSPPSGTDPAPVRETADLLSEAEEMLAEVAAAQSRGPTARVIGRRRAGQPTPPRWTTAGKARRGRLK